MAKNLQLTSHRISPLNEALKVRVMDEPGEGGASHIYAIYTELDAEKPAHEQTLINYTLTFQRGDPAKVGVNGLSIESLFAVGLDRLEGFQSGPFACEENATAIAGLKGVLNALAARSKRIAKDAAAAAGESQPADAPTSAAATQETSGEPGSAGAETK